MFCYCEASWWSKYTLLYTHKFSILPPFKTNNGIGNQVSGIKRGFLPDYLLPHKWLEDFGDNDTAIGLLVIFHDGNHHTGQG